MSVLPDDFFEQGKRLLSGLSEIDRRSAISRCYYAVYHGAVAAAARPELPEAAKKETGSHEQLIRRFEGCGKKGLSKLARRLRDKKRVRGLADYDLDELVHVSDAEFYFREARLLIEDIERLGPKRLEAAE